MSKAKRHLRRFSAPWRDTENPKTECGRVIDASISVLPSVPLGTNRYVLYGNNSWICQICSTAALGDRSSEGEATLKWIAENMEIPQVQADLLSLVALAKHYRLEFRRILDGLLPVDENVVLRNFDAARSEILNHPTEGEHV
jgi:hypothetical protein